MATDNNVNDFENEKENEVNIESTNEAQTEATNLQISEPQVTVARQGLRSFLEDDEEDEPQEEEKFEPQKSGISEQLKQQRPVMSSNLQSFLDEP